jgi:hypothetical protein
MYCIPLRIHIFSKAPTAKKFNSKSDEGRDGEPDYSSTNLTGDALPFALREHSPPLRIGQNPNTRQ